MRHGSAVLTATVIFLIIFYSQHLGLLQLPLSVLVTHAYPITHIIAIDKSIPD